jgi:RNA-binding protein
MRRVTGKQRRHLRALGQRLAATLHVGQEGVSEAVVRQADAQLEAHELVKVRVGDNAPEDRHATAEALAQRTGAHLAQVLGRTALLYRRHGEAPTIVLPEEEAGD